MAVNRPDVVIVGAGIAGSVLAHEARTRGFETVVIDPFPEKSASRAALAIGKDSWHKGAQRVRSAWSVRWYLSRGWAKFPTTTVSSEKHGPKAASDYYLVDPVAPLVRPDLYAEAKVTERNTVVAQDEEYLARLTVIAAGPRTWRLLGLPESSERWGHTLVSITAHCAAPLIVHHYRPYHSLVVARVGETVRVGSSMAKTFSDSKAQMRELLLTAEQKGFLSESGNWQELAGVRVIHPEETGKPVWKTPHVVGLTGFARCGFSLAPARAAEVLDQAFNPR